MLNSKIKVRALSDLKFGLHEGVLRGRAKNLKRFFRHFRAPSELGVLSSKIKFLINLYLLFGLEGVRRGRVKKQKRCFSCFESSHRVILWR